MASFLAPIVDHPDEYVLRNARADTLVAGRLELAIDAATRRRGLLGRDGLEEGHALVIAPCGGVHTFFMRFPIDVLFVRRDGRVVKCAHAVRPWRIALAPTAYAAIECPAGTLRRSGTDRGDRVVFERASRQPETLAGP